MSINKWRKPVKLCYCSVAQSSNKGMGNDSNNFGNDHAIVVCCLHGVVRETFLICRATIFTKSDVDMVWPLSWLILVWYVRLSSNKKPCATSSIGICISYLAKMYGKNFRHGLRPFLTHRKLKPKTLEFSFSGWENWEKGLFSQFSHSENENSWVFGFSFRCVRNGLTEVLN